ncbi:double zinc ribbon domain-containing protein, partial [Halorhodospira neutriphila]|uniref:double zinc ribbon domain-containing protein n=1 Tax=Halorhodospira neutriphila TaxID=168379 RepID=UPI001F5B949A
MVNFLPTRLLNKYAARGLDALYPPRCRLCGAPGAAGLELCGPCRAELPWNTPASPACALPRARAGPRAAGQGAGRAGGGVPGQLGAAGPAE